MLMWHDHMAWHVSLGIILAQQEILKDLDDLFWYLRANLNLGVKLIDEFDYSA
jgi:hypothetical protein